MVVATKFSINLQKLIVQYASMSKKIQSVMGSGVLDFVESKMMLSSRSTRKTHHIRIKKQQFQRNIIVVNFFIV